MSWAPLPQSTGRDDQQNPEFENTMKTKRVAPSRLVLTLNHMVGGRRVALGTCGDGTQLTSHPSLLVDKQAPGDKVMRAGRWEPGSVWCGAYGTELGTEGESGP